LQRHADILTRQEATGIPNLLVAPRTPPSSNSREIYENGVGDFRGYYEDGAYIASAQSFADSSEVIDEEAGVDPQLAYFDSILARYESLKEQLQQTPPPNVVKKLDQYHPTHVAALNSYMAKWWIQRLKDSEPLPAQIACMNKKSVFRLIGLITHGSLLKRGSEVGVGASLWAWALLARLPDRGELNSDEIGVIRELGKKAVLVAMGLRNVKSWDEGMKEVEEGFDADLEEVEETVDMTNEDEIYLDLGDEVDERDDLEDGEWDAAVDTTSKEEPILEVNYSLTANCNGNTAAAENAEEQIEQELAPGDTPINPKDLADAQARILSLLNEKVPEHPVNIEAAVPAVEKPPKTISPTTWNTIATVDMIITIAGEVYGQRDLLEFRTFWEEIM
jgi:hypothetical protein